MLLSSLCVASCQNYNIYRKLCVDVLSMPLGEGAYGTCADLRDMLLSLVGALAQSPEAKSPAAQEFERLLLVAHYSATRAACMGLPQLKELVAKVTVSLLRYTDILPADRAFYEAGSQAKVGGCPSVQGVWSGSSCCSGGVVRILLCGGCGQDPPAVWGGVVRILLLCRGCGQNLAVQGVWSGSSWCAGCVVRILLCARGVVRILLCARGGVRILLCACVGPRLGEHELCLLQPLPGPQRGH